MAATILQTESKEEPQWLSTIQQLLHERDLREKVPFQNISISYNLLLDENGSLSKRCNDLSQAVLQLKQDNWNKPSLYMNRSFTDPPDLQSDASGSGKDHKRNKKWKKQNKSDDPHCTISNNFEFESVKDDNESLRKELMDVYRLKKENEEALSRLKKQCMENEELILNQTRSINEMSTKHSDLLIAHNELKEADERLKSNLSLLNTESVELRKAHDHAMKELDQYKDENRRLTEQLLKLKESQMDQMDALNEEYEKYRKINAAKMAAFHKQEELQMNDPNNMSSSNRNSNHHNTGSPTLSPKPTSLRSTRSLSLAPNDSSNKKKPGWIFSGLFGGKEEKKEEPKTQRSQTVDFTSFSGPVVDLFGPSLFNITPPQLKSKMWQAHSSDVSALEFDQTGKKLISGGSDKLVKIWDTDSGQELGTLRGCTSAVLCTRYAPNYAFVCAAGNDCQLHLWNVKTQRQIRVYNGHSNKITSLAFTRDSRLIFSASHDRTIKLWDLETAACRYTMSAHSSVNDLTLSPDEYYIATAHLDGCIRFWSKRDRKELFKLTDHQPMQTIGVEFSPPDGVEVLTSGKDGKIIIWDLRKQQKLHEITHKEYKNTNISGRPCYSPDGQYIIGGSSMPSKTIQDKYSLFIWKVKSATLEHKLTEHSSQISRVVWHGRGGVASSDRNGMILMWC